MILVTGGCGFIGSAFILDWLNQRRGPVLNLDLLTYAGHPGNLREVQGRSDYRFVRGDIADAPLVARLLGEHRPRAIVHFAAESHVDRSIAGPEPSLQTKGAGTGRLLQPAPDHWRALPAAEAAAFRFINVSTDEVFGSLGPRDAGFDEQHPYRPSSPYSASKAAADHLARAWRQAFDLPVVTTNCSNNYGPRQFPEKLIPLMVHNALARRPLPVYGDGLQVRDWLHVEDHCSALRAVLERGRPGETYNIGGRSQKTNLDVVQALCEVLDEARPGLRHAALIRHVDDRPGHDRRYAIDDRKITGELGWQPTIRFEDGLRDTVHWYLAHGDWVDSVTSGAYRRWAEQQYPSLHP